MIEKRMARRGQGGFTLIELLVVIAILAVLAGAAIIGIGAMRDNAKKTACKSDMDTIQTAAEALAIELDDPSAVTKASLVATDGYLKKVKASEFNLTYTNGEFVASPVTGGGKYQGVKDC